MCRKHIWQTGTRKVASNDIFKIQYVGYLPRGDYTQNTIPPLHDIPGDSENKRSVSKVICGAEHESSTRKGVSGQGFKIKYVCISFLKYLYSAFY